MVIFPYFSHGEHSIIVADPWHPWRRMSFAKDPGHKLRASEAGGKIHFGKDAEPAPLGRQHGDLMGMSWGCHGDVMGMSWDIFRVYQWNSMGHLY